MNSSIQDLSRRPGWDSRLLFSPLNTLSRPVRALAVCLTTLLTVVWSGWRNGRLVEAWTLPDVRFYVLMAERRISEVPAPFSARPLAPMLARSLALLTHTSIHMGFTLLAYASLLATLLAVFWLMVRSAAPRWMLLLVAVVPFWPVLLGNVGLPDPLYSALFALLLVALETGELAFAAVLMFPLMLARESTWLALLCVLAVDRRRFGWRRCAIAVVCAATGAVLVKHLSAGGLPNPEHLSGGLYMAGKLAANFARSLGVVPWSNVYPELCGTPAWQHALVLGSIRSVGVCSLSSDDPLQVLGAVLTLFGVLPLLLIMLWVTGQLRMRGTGPLVRFCVLYGGISYLLAPTLGTWYTRLFGYGWPLFFVALPRMLVYRPWSADQPSEAKERTSWGALILVQLLVCAYGQTFFSYKDLGGFAALEGLWAALFLVQCRARPNAL